MLQAGLMTPTIFATFGWVRVCLALAGVLVCAFAVRRSLWALVIAFGWVLDGVSGLLFIFQNSFGAAGSAPWQFGWFLGSVLGMVARAAIVAGIGGALFAGQNPTRTLATATSPQVGGV